eukprot:c13752_g1_i1 orf=72-1256(-)
MGVHISPLLCFTSITWFIMFINLAICTHSVHFFGSKHHHKERHVKDDAMSSKPEVQEYVNWLARVRAKYDRDSVEGFHVPNEFPEDKVYSTLKMRVEKVITVNQVPGMGNFQTVQDAIDSVPKNNNQRTIIQIAAGIYQEKVKIPKDKPFITVEGAGMNSTTITWDDTATSSKSTFKSATFTVMAPGFVARDLTFQNTAPAPPPGAVGAQAVALQTSGDQSAFYGCAFLGAQDTLYDHRGRHYFKDCWIQGSIDFIFGDGLSLYEGCMLYVIDTPGGSLTAQKRKTEGEDTGFVFLNCSITGTGTVYLGRAWGAYSRVVYIYTRIDTIILPGGWNDWGISSRDKTAFYGEYKCWGPGADLQNRVAWAHELTDSQAEPFMSTSFIDGQSWLDSIS